MSFLYPLAIDNDILPGLFLVVAMAIYFFGWLWQNRRRKR